MARQRGIFQGGNREEPSVCDVERGTMSPSDSAVKFLLFTVIYVVSPLSVGG